MELDGSISFALQPILVVFGLLLNCLQLYLAACKTPEPLKLYSILIIVFAVADIGTSIGELVSRIRIIAFPQAIVFVSNGLCTYGGPISCYLWQSITAHFMIYSVYLMFLSFGYRYYVIYHGSPSVMSVFISVGISYVPSFIQVALTFQAMLPALFAIGSGSFAITALDLYHHPFLEHLIWVRVSGNLSVVRGRQSVTAHFMIFTVYLMFVSFGYRYYVIYHGPTTVKAVLISLGISYIPSFIQVVVYSLGQDEPELVRQAVQRRFPEYNLTGTVITGNLNYTNPALIYLSLHMTCPTPFLYFGILYFRQRVLWKLDSLSESLSIHTKSMHEQLLKALTFQALLPATFAIGSGSFAMAALDLYHHQFLEHLVLTSCCLSPALSPLGSIFFIKPYRDFVKHRFSRRRRASHVDTTTNMRTIEIF
ncbi:unnamed protein product [Caenorhabditis auriculariae]|uniref:G protein-coupled receptor n=1 Tax=Caenorhabditis auriculariae TaxID=2777116 RepID=A0A8S1HDA3_9PELO|nr:unnamed protein product [Caenorhabditis auriculariae]